MKKLLIPALAAIFLCNCSPSPDDPETPTNPSTSTTISTGVAGILTGDKNDSMPGIYVTVGGRNNTNKAGWFWIPEAQTYQYLAKLEAKGSTSLRFYETRKTMVLTDAALNYVRMKMMARFNVANIHNSNPTIAVIYPGGFIKFGTNSIAEVSKFNQAIDPLFYAGISVGYLNPLSPDFAVMLPAYPMADDGNQKYFLLSAGLANLELTNSVIVSDDPLIDLYPGKTATLNLTIPPAMLGNAPDTIGIWRLEKGKWVRDGFASKTGDEYEGQIKKVAITNFAKAVKGVYKTIRLRSESGAPIVNATLKVKGYDAVLSETLTDGDGNSIVFLPADLNLTLEVYQCWNNPIIVQSNTINTGGSGKNIDITIANSTYRVYNVAGNAFYCNGTKMQSGTLIISNGIEREKYYAPVKDGRYNITMVSGGGLSAADTHPFIARLVGSDGNQEAADTVVLAKVNTPSDFTINTCKIQPNLYMNYTVDGVAKSVIGDLSLGDPMLLAYTAFTNGSETHVLGATANKGIQFDVNLTTVGERVNAILKDVRVDGITRTVDDNMPRKVIFTRVDKTFATAFLFGSADFYYKDQSGVSHAVTCNFKLKYQ